MSDFRPFTEEEKQKIAAWCRSEEATRIFKQMRKDVKRESKEFVKRTTLSYEQLHRPFTI